MPESTEIFRMRAGTPALHARISPAGRSHQPNKIWSICSLVRFSLRVPFPRMRGKETECPRVRPASSRWTSPIRTFLMVVPSSAARAFSWRYSGSGISTVVRIKASWHKDVPLEYDADSRMKTRLETGGHRPHGRWTTAEKLQRTASVWGGPPQRPPLPSHPELQFAIPFLPLRAYC